MNNSAHVNDMEGRFIPDRSKLSSVWSQFNITASVNSFEDTKQYDIGKIYAETLDRNFSPKQRGKILRLPMNYHHYTGRGSLRKNTTSKDIFDPWVFVPKVSNSVMNNRPVKVLDAPDYKDNFYGHYITSGPKGLLIVALGDIVYFYNIIKRKLFFTMSEGCVPDGINVVKLTKCGDFLFMGGKGGSIEICDVLTGSRFFDVQMPQNGDVTSADWNENNVAVGFKNGDTEINDLRMNGSSSDILPNSGLKFRSHTGRVCNLSWSSDGTYLATGGEDDVVNIWDVRYTKERFIRFDDHTGAVKALSWSPHQRGILATGGGSRDKTFKIRNIFTKAITREVYTGAQISSIDWNRTIPERIYTSHGYGSSCVEFNVAEWDMKKASNRPKVLYRGHTKRIIDMSLTPEGTNIITGSPDERLMMWDCDISHKKYSMNRKLCDSRHLMEVSVVR